MPDSLNHQSLTQPDARKAALEALDKAGAHFVLCGADKRPKAKAWQKTRPPLDAVLRHNGPVGVIPASLGCVVVDVDEGGEQAADEVIKRFGQPLAKVPTRRRGGWHLWFRCREADSIGNIVWRDGDIRGAKGQAILWQPELVAEGLACTAPVAYLMAADLDRLPRAEPKGGEPGNRNNTLNKDSFLAAVNGQATDAAAAAARQDGLPEPEIQATVESAKEGAERAGKRTLVPNPFTPQGLAFCLAGMGVGLRLNERGRRFEYQRPGELWKASDDQSSASLRYAMLAQFAFRKGEDKAAPLNYLQNQFYDLRNALGDGLRCDPFLEWLKAVPKWDGKPRIDLLLEDTAVRLTERCWL